MAINGTQKATKTEWKRIQIPNGKLAFIYTSKETGKASMSFEVNDDPKITFMVSTKLVAVNSDHTGFIVGLPVGEVKLSKYVSKGKYEELKAESIEDLGYPFAE